MKHITVESSCLHFGSLPASYESSTGTRLSFGICLSTSFQVARVLPFRSFSLGDEIYDHADQWASISYTSAISLYMGVHNQALILPAIPERLNRPS